jgi:hypothetical protein
MSKKQRPYPWRWVGSDGDIPSIWMKTLTSWRGCNFDVHDIVRADKADCFHTHPAYAIRIVLGKGYIEEMYDGTKRRIGRFHIGLVPPSYCHRIDSLIDGPSRSIWLRGPIKARVKLYGKGWDPNEPAFEKA